MLRATDFEKSYPTIQLAEEASKRAEWIDQDTQNRQRFSGVLYDMFDPLVPKPRLDLYSCGMNLAELIAAVALLKEDGV